MIKMEKPGLIRPNSPIKDIILSCPTICEALDVYKEFYTHKLMKLFREVERYSEFSLNFVLNEVFDEDLFILMMVLGAFLDDMPLTCITAFIATIEPGFELYEAGDLAIVLDRCHLYPESHVKKALNTLTSLIENQIIFIPKIIINTFKYYQKASTSCNTSKSSTSDSDIRNSDVFKRLVEKISKIMTDKIYSGMRYFLGQSIYKETYLIKHLCIKKTMLLGLVWALRERDAVLSTSTLLLSSTVTPRLNTLEFVDWLKKTETLVADDLEKAGDFLLCLKRSQHFEIPPPVEVLIITLMEAFSCSTEQLVSCPSYAQPGLQRSLEALPTAPSLRVPSPPPPSPSPPPPPSPARSEERSSSEEPQPCSTQETSRAQKKAEKAAQRAQFQEFVQNYMENSEDGESMAELLKYDEKLKKIKKKFRKKMGKRKGKGK